jgi:hypothetical protein
MTEPRNVAHDKKIAQEKKHRGDTPLDTTATPQPGRKPHVERPADDAATTKVDSAGGT